jgi:hypothetical protein
MPKERNYGLRLAPRRSSYCFYKPSDPPFNRDVKVRIESCNIVQMSFACAPDTYEPMYLFLFFTSVLSPSPDHLPQNV